jgi:sorbitol-specific phosphotransferase system component IIBC
MPRLSRLAVFTVGAALGLTLWAVPALLSDEPLPWDSQGPVYAVALVIIGFILGFLAPGQLIATVMGVFIGQLVVLLARVATNSATSALWLVSAMLLAGYTVVAAGIGAVLGNALRRRVGPVPRTGERRSG